MYDVVNVANVFLLPTSSLSRALQTVCPVEFLKFCRQIVAGMFYLYQKGFVHRDLAARNILLDSANNCKVRSRISVVCSHHTVVSASANIALCKQCKQLQGENFRVVHFPVSLLPVHHCFLLFFSSPINYLRLLILACHVLWQVTSITSHQVAGFLSCGQHLR